MSLEHQLTMKYVPQERRRLVARVHHMLQSKAKAKQCVARSLVGMKAQVYQITATDLTTGEQKMTQWEVKRDLEP